MCSVKNLEFHDKLENVVISLDAKIKEEAESTAEDEDEDENSSDDGSQVAARTRYHYIPRRHRVAPHQARESGASSADWLTGSREIGADSLRVAARHKAYSHTTDKNTRQRTDMEFLEIAEPEIVPNPLRVDRKRKRKKRRKSANSGTDLPATKKSKQQSASLLDLSVDEIVKDISNRAENYTISGPSSGPLVNMSSTPYEVKKFERSSSVDLSSDSIINDISDSNHVESNVSEESLPPLVQISSTSYEAKKTKQFQATSSTDLSVNSIVNDVSNLNPQSNPVTDKPTPPLVKIFAIPNEVEALLKSDIENSRKRAREYDSENIAQVSRATEYKLRTGLRSNSQKSAPTVAPSQSTLRHWAMLRRRFNCREVQIKLERIDAPQRCYIPEISQDQIENNFENELPVCNDSVSTTSLIDNKRSVGIELQNLNLALKKLGKLQDDIDQLETNLHVPVNFKNGHIVLSRKNRPFYRSIACKTRFSSQKRLIHHYLSYHSGSNRLECGVCRSQCSGKTELKKHLTLHCMAIPKSDEDGSPFDIKGPCDQYKKKVSCKSCKKKFVSILSLETHHRLCHSRAAESSAENRCRESITLLDGQENNDLLQQIKTEPISVDDETESEFIHNSEARTTLENCSTAMENHDQVAAVNSSYSGEKNDPTDLLGRLSSSSRRPVLTVWPCAVCNTQFRLAENFLQHQKKYSPQENTVCERCGTRFPSVELYNVHVRYAHSAENPHYKSRCLACNQTFITRDYLRHHIMHIHVEELRQLTEDPQQPSSFVEMECRTCNVIFKNRKHYLEHCLYYFDDDLCACTMCDRKFFGRYKAHCHMKKNHFSEDKQKNYIYRCTECEEGFIYQSHLHSHMRHVHSHIPSPRKNLTADKNMISDNSDKSEPLLVCHVCDEEFNQLELLIDHETKYSNQGGFRCALCYRNFFTSMLLMHHVKFEHAFTCSQGQKKCMHCQALILETSFNAHLKHFHNNDPGESTHVRGSSSTSVQDADVTSTMRPDFMPIDQGDDLLSIPENIDPQFKIEYTCAICDLKFSSSADLRMHSRKNSCSEHDQSRYIANDEVIDVCNFESNVMISNFYSVDLAEYEKIHDNDNNDSINEDASVNIVDETSQSEEITENLDNFVCEICQINYYNLAALRKHHEEHTNAGAYVCRYCKRKFMRRFYCERHENKHKIRKMEKLKGITPIYYCETCDEKFASSKSKHIHYAHVHRVLLSSTEEAEIEQVRRQQRKEELEERLKERLPQKQTKITDYTFPTSKISSQISEPSSSKKYSSKNLLSDNRSLLSPKKSSSRKKSSRKKSRRYAITHTFQNPLKIKENKLSINENSIMRKKYCECTDHSEGTAMEKSLQELLFEDNKGTTCARTRPRFPTKRIKFMHEKIKKECDLQVIKVKKHKKSDTEFLLTLCDVCGLIFNCKRDLRIHQKSHLAEANDESSEKPSVQCPEKKETIEVEKKSEPTVEEVQKEKATVTSSQIVNNPPSIIKLLPPSSKKSQIIHTLMTLKREHDYNQVKCRICTGTFRNTELLAEHLKNAHHLTPNLRAVCDPIILRRRQITASQPASPESTLNYCTICDKKVDELDDHIVTHHSSVTTTFPTIRESHPSHVISTKIKPRVETTVTTTSKNAMILTGDSTPKNVSGFSIVRNITSAMVKKNPTVSGTTSINSKTTTIENSQVFEKLKLKNTSLKSNAGGISIVQTGPQVYQLIPISANSVLIPSCKPFKNIPK